MSNFSKVLRGLQFLHMRERSAPAFKKGKENGVFTIAESSLSKYAQSLGAVELPAEPFPSSIPQVMSSSLDSASNRKYVYIGLHHTFVHFIEDDSAADKHTYTVDRGPSDSPKGKGKLNSIFRRGILPSPFHIRKLLYGPGVYLTHRPAVGNLSAAGGLLNLSPEELKSGAWEIVQIHVFVPVETYKSWERISIKLVPDGGGVFNDASEIERVRREDMLDGAKREVYGLLDNDVVVAKSSVEKGSIVEEVAISGEALKEAKLLAEVIPSRENFLNYMEYRQKHRHAERPPGVEWSEVAVPVLERGNKESGIVPIKNTKTYEELKDYVVDFQDLVEKKNTHRYWKAFNCEKTRERDYIFTTQ